MKIYFLPFTLITLFAFLFVSCEKEEAPDAAFSATEGSSTNTAVTINFTDNSSNSPSDWLWTFEGGTPATSTEKNPTVTYTSNGTFDVTLEVTNDGGSNQVTMMDYINIVKFNNPTHTDIDITINSKDKTIPVDDYVLFASIDNTTVNIDAETHGSTNSGDVIGLWITWTGPVDLNEFSLWDLNVAEDIVFFYVTNTGSADFNSFVVNVGHSEYEIAQNIIIPHNSNPTATGYYHAINQMEVEASNSSTSISWVEGIQFNLPGETNQSINLDDKKKNTKETKEEKQKVLDPNVGNIYQTGVK